MTTLFACLEYLQNSVHQNIRIRLLVAYGHVMLYHLLVTKVFYCALLPSTPIQAIFIKHKMLKNIS